MNLISKRLSWVAALAAVGSFSAQAAFDVRLYLDIPRVDAEDIGPVLADPDFPDNPDITDFHFSAADFFTDEATSLSTSGYLEWPQAFGEEAGGDSGFNDYGGAISGHLYVPEDGNYRFYIKSDDESSLYFNPEGSEFLDPTADGVEPVAFETTCCGDWELNPSANETSVEFALEAGVGYAFEVIWQEGGGGDWVQVGWSKDGGAPTRIPAFYVQRDVRYGASSADGITSFEGDTFPFGQEGEPMEIGVGVSFEKDAEGHASTSFAWEVDAGDGFEPIEDVMSEDDLSRISGLNSPALTFSALSAAWDLYLFRPTVDGEEGPEIELEVEADETAPAVVSARGVAFPSSILVTFSEGVDMDTATNPDNYEFAPEKTINSITPQGMNSVLIDIGPYTTEEMTLTVSGVEDIALAENQMEETTVNVNLNPGGLLAYWKFDGESTTDSAGGLVGEAESGAAFSDDTPLDNGDSLDLGASSDSQLVRVTGDDVGAMLNKAAENDDITFSYWQKLNSVANSSGFWAVSEGSGGGNRGAQAHSPWSNNNIYFDTAGCCDGGTQRINASIDTFVDTYPDFFLDWHHFAFVKEGSDKTIWVDGKLFLRGTNTAPLPQDFTELVIGAEPGGNNSTQGFIDDFAVFAGALLPSELASLADMSRTPENVLEGAFGELSIAQDLEDTTAVENSTVTLEIIPEGSAIENVQFQWMRDGEVLVGEETNTLTLDVALEDNGSTFSAVGANANGAFNQIESSEITLTVVADTERPNIVSIEGNPFNSGLTVTFDKVMANGPLSDAANYSVAPTDGGSSIGAESVSTAADGMSVSIALESALEDATRYTLSTENLVDIASDPNTLVDPTGTFLSYGRATGGLNVLFYELGGGGLGFLADAEPGEYPDGYADFGAGTNMENIQARQSGVTTYFESPSTGDINVAPAADIVNNYAQILFGYIRPPETADYRFFLASDDNAQLWLSTSEDPEDSELIANEPGWNGVRQYDDGKEDNWSEAIPLEAGQLYYVEARMSEGGGGDNLAVTWTSTTDGEDPPVPSNGTNPISGEFLVANLPVFDEITVLSSTPAEGAAGVLVDAGSFSIVLKDGVTDKVNTDSIAVMVNGSAVETSVSTDAEGNHTVSGAIPDLPINTEVDVQVTYESAAGESFEVSYSFTTEDIPTLNPGWAVGLDEGTERGFNVRSVQWDTGRGNSTAAAEEQLADPDDDRVMFTGEGVFDVINFNQDIDDGGGNGVFRGGSPTEAYQIEDTNLAEAGLIADDNTDNFSIEATTFLAFPEAGIYTMGTNSDDGFRTTAGISNSVEDSTLELGVFSGGRGAANDAFQDTYRVNVTEPGIYAVRFITYEAGGGASSEWYTVDDGVPTLINDDGGIMAYVGRTRDPEHVEDVSITSISADAGNVTIEYTGTLQSAPAVQGPYSDVDGAASPYTFAPDGNVFLRVQ